MSQFGYQSLGFGGGGTAAAKVTSQDDLTHWWKIDDTSDSIGSATLTLNNGAAVDPSTYRFGTGSLASDGVNDFAVNLDGVTDLASAYTWSCWWRPTALGVLDRVVQFDVDASTAAATMVGVLQHSGTYRFYHAVATGTDVNDTSAGTSAVNDWTFLAQTWDGSTVTYYRANTDSDAGGSASPDSSVTAESTDSASGVQAGVDSLNIGVYASAYYGAGNVDDVRLYNVALDSTAIGNIYGTNGEGDFP